MGAISSFIMEANKGHVESLKRVHYMSPQDSSFTAEGFACARCDWKRESEVMKEKGLSSRIAFCINPQVQSYVEKAGCCNVFQYKQVTT